jgi:hypothetical protein
MNPVRKTTAEPLLDQKFNSMEKKPSPQKVLFLDYPDDDVELEQRFYSKKALCQAYGISKNTLAAYINRFKEKFEAIGYNKFKKKLTVKEVELLCELIGRP